jgi:hypothetical protein
VPKSDPPFVSLREHRLPRNSKEVAYVQQLLKEKHEREMKIRRADIHAQIEAARNRTRVAKAPGFQQPKIELAKMKPPRNVVEALQPWKKVLAPSHSALQQEIKEQQQRLRTMRKHSDKLFGLVGDPTLLDFLDTADSISVTTSPAVDPFGGSFIFVIPPKPVTSIASFNNLVRFTSTAVSFSGNGGQFAWLDVTMTYVFSFVAPVAGVCTVIPAFLPNAVFNVTTPASQYVFPFSNTDPQGTMAFTVNVRADTFLPGIMPPMMPSETVTGMGASPPVDLAGVTGFHTVSGGLSAGAHALPSSVTLSPFLVIPGAKVVISVVYFYENFLTEGGTATLDASSRTTFGFNVPFILVKIDY